MLLFDYIYHGFLEGVSLEQHKKTPQTALPRFKNLSTREGGHHVIVISALYHLSSRNRNSSVCPSVCVITSVPNARISLKCSLASPTFSHVLAQLVAYATSRCRGMGLLQRLSSWLSLEIIGNDYLWKVDYVTFCMCIALAHIPIWFWLI